MAEVKWIKLSTSMFDDEKIKLIEHMPDSDTILVIWMKLLIQAGKTNSSGYIFLNENIPYTEEMLSTIFDRPLSTIRLALKTLEDLAMIGIDDNSFISITNWEKHQNIEGMDRIREQTRRRVARHRKNKRLEEPKKDSNATSNVTVTDGNATDIDIDIDKEYIYTLFNYWNEKEIIKHRKRTQAMESHINARLQEYSVDELKKAIDNYSLVLRSDDYYWTHKWTLQDFMKPSNVVRFVDDADPLSNFKSNKKEKISKKGGIDLNDFNLDD